MFPNTLEAQAGLQENVNQENMVHQLAKAKIKNEIADVLWNMKTVTETFRYPYRQATEEILIEVAQELGSLGFKTNLCSVGDNLRFKVSI